MKIRDIFWEFLSTVGFWVPVDRHLPDPRFNDWVIISYVDTNGDGTRCVPEVAEYSRSKARWHTMASLESKSVQYFLDHDCVVTHWHTIPRRRLRPFTKK